LIDLPTVEVEYGFLSPPISISNRQLTEIYIHTFTETITNKA